MRYGQGGGLNAAARQRREAVRMRAVERFAAGDKTTDIAADLRVGVRQVEKWRSAWRHGGVQALRSKGHPGAQERLTDEQWARLEAELTRGPLTHGFDDQHWTLARVKTLIGRLFHLSYTEPGVWYLLQRHGWSCQVPARRAIERDEEAITTWRSQVWPRVEAPRRPRGRGWSSKTSPASR
jgi:transposase